MTSLKKLSVEWGLVKGKFPLTPPTTGFTLNVVLFLQSIREEKCKFSRSWSLGFWAFIFN